jgi:hypothetical protein
VAAAGMRRHGCSRSLDRGLDPDRSNPGLTCRPRMQCTLMSRRTEVCKDSK